MHIGKRSLANHFTIQHLKRSEICSSLSISTVAHWAHQNLLGMSQIFPWNSSIGHKFLFSATYLFINHIYSIVYNSVAPDIETNLIFNLIPNLISGLSGSGHIFHYQAPNLISGYNLILGSQPDIRLLFNYIRLIFGFIRPDIRPIFDSISPDIRLST